MKLVLVAALAALVVLSPAFGQKANGKQADAEQTLRQIEQEMLDHLQKGDASTHERYLADTYVYTDTDGTVMGKTQSVADIRSGALKVPATKLDDIKVQLYGDTAIVTLRSVEKGTTYKGKDLSGSYRWTDVFIKRNGKWQLMATQGTRITTP